MTAEKLLKELADAADLEAKIEHLLAINADLLEATIAFEAGLSEFCDGPERDRLRAVIAKATGAENL